MVDADNKRRAAEGEDYSKEVSTVEVLDNRVVIVPPSRWWLLFSLLAVVLFLSVWSIVGELTARVEGWGIVSSKGSQQLSVDAPHHGIVRQVLVEAGAFVQEGDTLLEILAAHNHTDKGFQIQRVRAPQTAKVITITTEAGRYVEKKQVLLRLQTPGESPLLHLYLPPQVWRQVRTGQRTLLHIIGTQALEGKVISVAKTPQHRQKILSHWGDGILLPRGDIFYQATCALTQPLATNPAQHGYSWLLANREPLNTGTQKRFSITVRHYSPLSLILPWLGESTQ